MYTYITTKIVNAEPMTFLQYIELHPRPHTCSKDEPGYYIQYPDGYKSWCPKDEFERTSRLVTAVEADSINFDPSTL